MHYGQNVKRYVALPYGARSHGREYNFLGSVVAAEEWQYAYGRKFVKAKAVVRVFPVSPALWEAQTFRGAEAIKDRAHRQAQTYALLMNKRLGSGDPKNPWGPLHDGKRWCEDLDRCGFRQVGAAHEIINLRHTGYYMDGDMQSDVTHGLVLQMPASKEGFCRYLAGRSDPCNDGAALIDFSTWYDDKEDAARAADSTAEHDAEEAREYHEAWSAGSRSSNHDEDAKRYRADLLDHLVTSKKEGRKFLPKDGAIHRSIVARAEHLLDRMREAREERDKLIDDAPTYDKRLRDAFNEGFGREVV